MNNLCTGRLNSLNELKEILQDIDTDNGETNEIISGVVSDMESDLRELTWFHSQLTDFFDEMKARKNEGEAVIDEILEVLCLDSEKTVK